MVVLGILVFILILSAIVVIHEGGHFFVAKKSGILCYEFAIGMGPVIFQKKFGETVFSIRAIPIGGFVAMAGEDIESDPIKGATLAKLTVDPASGLVSEIYVLKSAEDKVVLKEDLNLSEYYQIVDRDLIGTKDEKDGELFISVLIDGEVVRYELAKDCMIRFKKKEAFQIAPYNRLFIHKALWKRFLTVFAGPFMNFVLAFFVFFFLGLATGYVNYKTTVVGEVSENASAAIAGMQDGDKILYIGDDEVYEPYTKWSEVSEKLKAYAYGEEFSGTVRVLIERNGETIELMIKPFVYVQTTYLFFKVDGSNSLEINYSDLILNMTDMPSYKAGLRDGDIIKSIKGDFGETLVPATRSDVLRYFATGDGAESSKFTITVLRGEEEVTIDEISTYKKQIFDDNNIEVCRVQIGVVPTVTRNIGRLLIEPFKSIGSSATTILKTLGALFKRNSGISIMDLSGPVGIASATVNMLKQGAASVFEWMAILSVNVGLINLLPLPALDGGRIAFILYELITRRKPNSKVENIIHTVGFILLMILFVFVAFNDVFRLFK